MTYELNVIATMQNGVTLKMDYIGTDAELTTKSGCDAVKFKEDGKKRFTWVYLPNDYQMENYYNKFEIVVKEATTGRRVYTISK